MTCSLLSARVLLVCFGVSVVAAGQAPAAKTPAAAPAQPVAPVQLSPKAAYDAAMRPLARTRSSVSNWSDAEVAALKVAMQRAAEDCKANDAARDAAKLSGETLVDLAHLCALGQDFGRVEIAAKSYLGADGAKAQVTAAYAELVNAELHLKQEDDALKDGLAMMAAVPYDALVAETIDEAINYMQFVHTADALKLDAAREPLLLARMAAVAKAAVDDPAAAQKAEPTGGFPQSLHELYADGMGFAALEALARMPADATVAELDKALPEALGPDDALPIASTRKRFALLGKPLPVIAGTGFLSSPGRMPQIPAANAETALLLIPDWCAQCVKMGTQMPITVFNVDGHEAYLYGLLAATVKQNKGAAEGDGPKVFDPAQAASLLEETPTELVQPRMLEQFAATDFPFLVVTDAHGIVRVAQPVTEDALNPGGTLDSAIARVGERWPMRQIPEGLPGPVHTRGR